MTTFIQCYKSDTILIVVIQYIPIVPEHPATYSILIWTNTRKMNILQRDLVDFYKRADTTNSDTIYSDTTNSDTIYSDTTNSDTIYSRGAFKSITTLFAAF